MKKIILIYDDSVKPNKEIAEINGGRSFGTTIYKRKSLCEIADAAAHEKLSEFKIKSSDVIFVKGENAEAVIAQYAKLQDKITVCKLYSCYMIANPDEFAMLMKKACFAHEVYRVVQSSAVAEQENGSCPMEIYPDLESYFGSDSLGDCSTIESDAFTYLGIQRAFISFLTGGFDARFFNSLDGDYYTVTKKSSNIDKIKREYNFYYLLPEQMRHWFVQPFDYTENKKSASYTMERYHMTDVAIRYVHGAVDEEEFEELSEHLFRFLDDRTKCNKTPDEINYIRNKLYVEKVSDRIEQLKTSEGFGRIASYLETGTSFKTIDKLFDCYKEKYKAISDKLNNIPGFYSGCACVGHGDLCFSNILYQKDAHILKLIDPKGALEDSELYTDPLYDIAKLSHSVCGKYDFFNAGLYELSVDSDMKLNLKIDVSGAYTDKCRAIFEKKLLERNIDPEIIRVLEASLFISMLPLHMDNPKKVLGFIMNAAEMLNLG